MKSSKKNEIFKPINRIVVGLIVSLFLFQFTGEGEAVAAPVDVNLTKGQTLRIIYNEPIRDVVYANGGYYDVNKLDIFIHNEPFHSDFLAAFKLYNEFNDILWEYTPSETGIGYGFSFYDDSTWGLSHSFFPWEGGIDIDQFRDGIGSDNLLFSVTMVEGSLMISDFEIANMHVDSISSSDSYGIIDMDEDHYDFLVVPLPPAIWLFISGLVGIIFLKK